MGQVARDNIVFSLKVILVLFLLINITYSQTIVILSENINYPEINEYVNKLPAGYIVHGFVIKNNNSEIVKNKILKINPDLILFVGDAPIDNFLQLYYDIFKQKSLVYCCNFKLNKEIEISGIDYQFNYEKIESIIKQFNHIFLLKTNSNMSKLLSSLILENIQTVSIDSVVINNIQDIRKFFIRIPKNSIVINFMDVLEYDKDELSEEIESWNKKTVTVDFNNYGIISIVPNYNEITNLLVEYTLLNQYFKFQHVLSLNLNYKKLQNIDNSQLYFKFEKDIFETVFIK